MYIIVFFILINLANYFVKVIKKGREELIFHELNI